MLNFLSLKKKSKKTVGITMLIMLVIPLALSLVPIGADTAFATSTPTFTPYSASNNTNTGNAFFDTVGSIRWGDCGVNPLCGVVKGGRYLLLGVVAVLGQIFALLLGVAASLAKMMVWLGTRIPLLPIVTTGFELTLGFTNVLFILAIIIMAFATILRFESWAAKAMLKRLIIAALLVNFSFFIAGFILDTGNVFTGVFSHSFEPEEIGAAINPQKIILSFGAKIDKVTIARSGGTDETVDANTDEGRNLVQTIKAGKVDKKIVTYQLPLNQDDWGQFFAILQGLVLAVALTFLLMVSLLALAVMILIRNFHIAFLLVLMPLIWPISVMPALKKYWSEWWGSFMKWALFLPIVTFFIWLAVSTTKIMFQSSAGGGIYGQLQGLVDNDPFALIILLVFQTLFVAGLMIAGLKVGKRLSITGAALGLAGAAWVGSKIKGGTKRVGKFAVRNPVKTIGAAATIGAGPLGGAVAAGLAGLSRGGIKGTAGAVSDATRRVGRKTARGLSKAATAEGKKGVVGRLLTGNVTRKQAQERANQLASRASAADRVKKRQEELYANLTSEQFDAIPKEKLPKGDIDRTAYLMEATKRKKHKELAALGEDKVKALMESAQRAYNISNPEDAPAGEGVPGIKEIFAANPKLAANVTGKGMDEIISGFSASDLLKIDDVDAGIAQSIIRNANPKALQSYHEKATPENATMLMAHLSAAASPEIGASEAIKNIEAAFSEKIERAEKALADLPSTTDKAGMAKVKQLEERIKSLKEKRDEAKGSIATTSGKASQEAAQKLKYITDKINPKNDGPSFSFSVNQP